MGRGHRGGAARTQTWLTFRQAKALGGSVRKGERGTTVVYADRFIPKAEREIVPHAEAPIKATGADFKIGGQRAFYVSSADYIQVPPQPAIFGVTDLFWQKQNEAVNDHVEDCVIRVEVERA